MSAIGIFDSGVGGISVAQAVHRQLPAWPIIYSSDNANYPYGTKSEEDVIAATVRHTRALAERYPLSLLVIACNTASTVALPLVREALAIPVVGVVPAIKPAAKISAAKRIGLLATPGTVQRPYTDALIHQFAADCEVTKLGTRLLVDMAEAKLRGEVVDRQALARELQPLWDADVDTVVLGCTHFPLLEEELRAIRDDIQWVDSGHAIAQRCSALLASESPHETYEARAVFSAREGTESMLAGLHQFGIDRVDYL